MSKKREDHIQTFVGGLYIVCTSIKNYLEKNDPIDESIIELLKCIIEFEDLVQEHFTGDSGRNSHGFRAIANYKATRFEMELSLEESACFANQLKLNIEYSLAHGLVNGLKIQIPNNNLKTQEVA